MHSDEVGGKPVTEVPGETPTSPMTTDPVQVTKVPPRTTKCAAAPSDGADAAADERTFEVEPMFELERIEGELIRDAGSLLHAAESSANVTRIPGASLGGVSLRTCL